MDVNQVVAALIAIAAAALAAFGVVKSTSIRNAFVALLSESPHALREALDSLSSVVQAQGESIAYLRSELEAARAELEVTRAALSENSALRQRVAELEEQVRQLESELARRRKYTRKDYLARVEGDVNG